MQTTFNDWNGEGTWEAVYSGDSISIHRSTGEHDFHGIPRYVCHYSRAVDAGVSEPRLARSTSRDGLKRMLSKRFKVRDLGNLIGDTW